MGALGVVVDGDPTTSFASGIADGFNSFSMKTPAGIGNPLATI
jgi:hypothetical protein